MKRLNQYSPPATGRRRGRAGVVAGLAALGLSISACSSSNNDADAASDTAVDDGTPADSTAAAAGTDDNATATDPATGENGAPSGDSRGQLGFGGPGASGEVTAVDGSTITLEQVGQDGTITETAVETSDDTTVTAVVDGTLDDLTVGDEVIVNGGTDGDAATSIAEAGAGGMVFRGGAGGQPPTDGEFPAGGPPGDGQFPDGPPPADGQFPGGQPPAGVAPDGSGGPGGLGGPGGSMAFGTITEVGDGSITIEDADGASIVITVDDTTEIRVSQDRSVDDIEVGDTIRAQGETTDSTLTADSIVVQPD